MNSPTRRKNPPDGPTEDRTSRVILKLSDLFAENQEAPAGGDGTFTRINTNSEDKQQTFKPVLDIASRS